MRYLLLTLLLAGCPRNPPDYPEPAPLSGSPCERACKHLEALHCEEAKPTPKGELCASVCQHVEDSGYGSSSPACLEKVADCGAVKSCVK